MRLTGSHVALEPLGTHHAESLLAHLAGPDDDALWTYRPVERPADLEQMRAFVEATVASAVTFAVERDGEARGIVSMMRPDPANGVVEIGGILHARSVQRTPVTTETAYLLLRHAFDDLGYRRVEWKCDSLNEPSRVAARRLGFTYEGRFRHHVVVKGRNRDTDWFAIVDSDWPEIRAAHEAWLDPDNFDADGRQRAALRAPSS
jgi:RimJ/RimL family protein N-acetyltransferase